jgi:hypothetical protein
MRRRRDPASPWGIRLWIPDDEFEEQMALVRSQAGENVFTPGRGVDVEYLLEQVLGLRPDYRRLEDGVMGRTKFHPDGQVDVHISRELSDGAEFSGVIRRRLRSTIAHECSHIVFHRVLHSEDKTTDSASSNRRDQKPEIMCRMRTIENTSYQGEWWEYQANRGMVTLLLPRDLFSPTVREVLRRRNFESMLDAAADEALTLVVGELMDIFDTSFTMTIYRLQDLGFIPRGLVRSNKVSVR